MPLLTGARALRTAARQCMRRASSPGADHLTWRQYRQDFQRRLASLSERLRDGTWQPGVAKIVRIRTIANKEFTAVVPTVEDRIVHRALRNVLEPILEQRALLDFVSGYRSGRSRITAVRQAMHHVSRGYGWVADVDVADVCGEVTLDEVGDWLAQWISDGSFLLIVKRALQNLPTPLCPGSGLSPLLLNLRLVPVDWALKDFRVVRFADNYAVFCNSREEASRVFDVIRELLARQHLSMSTTKSTIRTDNPEDMFLIAG